MRKRYRVKVRRQYEETVDIWVPEGVEPSASFWERDARRELPESLHGRENIRDQLLKVEEVCSHPEDKIEDFGPRGKRCTECGESWLVAKRPGKAVRA
jgi:hypothetical protein